MPIEVADRIVNCRKLPIELPIEISIADRIADRLPIADKIFLLPFLCRFNDVLDIVGNAMFSSPA